MARSAAEAALLAGAVLSPILVAGCVSQSRYDALEAENRQLRQQLTAEQRQVGRLQGAIEYTVNSDLLFAPGSWEMRERGKQIIADLAAKLAPEQRNRLVVNGYTDNEPIGPALRRRGIASNQELSQKRAETVRDFLISRGARPDMISAQGHGEADPVAPNTTPRGRAQNRRVVLAVDNA